MRVSLIARFTTRPVLGCEAEGEGESGYRKDVRCQEVGVVLARDLGLEVLSREAKLVALRRLGSQLLGLLLEQLERVALINALALGGGDAVAHPLPELRARYLGCGGVLPVLVKYVSASAARFIRWKRK